MTCSSPPAQQPPADRQRAFLPAWGLPPAAACLQHQGHTDSPSAPHCHEAPSAIHLLWMQRGRHSLARQGSQLVAVAAPTLRILLQAEHCLWRLQGGGPPPRRDDRGICHSTANWWCCRCHRYCAAAAWRRRWRRWCKRRSRLLLLLLPVMLGRVVAVHRLQSTAATYEHRSGWHLELFAARGALVSPLRLLQAIAAGIHPFGQRRQLLSGADSVCKRHRDWGRGHPDSCHRWLLRWHACACNICPCCSCPRFGCGLGRGSLLLLLLLLLLPLIQLAGLSCKGACNFSCCRLGCRRCLLPRGLSFPICRPCSTRMSCRVLLLLPALLWGAVLQHHRYDQPARASGGGVWSTARRCTGALGSRRRCLCRPSCSSRLRKPGWLLLLPLQLLLLLTFLLCLPFGGSCACCHACACRRHWRRRWACRQLLSM